MNQETGELLERVWSHQTQEAEAFYQRCRAERASGWRPAARRSGSSGCWSAADTACRWAIRPPSARRWCAAEDGCAGCAAVWKLLTTFRALDPTPAERDSATAGASPQAGELAPQVRTSSRRWLAPGSFARASGRRPEDRSCIGATGPLGRAAPARSAAAVGRSGCTDRRTHPAGRAAARPQRCRRVMKRMASSDREPGVVLTLGTASVLAGTGGQYLGLNPASQQRWHAAFVTSATGIAAALVAGGSGVDRRAQDPELQRVYQRLTFRRGRRSPPWR